METIALLFKIILVHSTRIQKTKRLCSSDTAADCSNIFNQTIILNYY